MISYKPFWRTMESRGMTQYRLIKEYGVDNKLLFQLRHDGNITVRTAEQLCRILDCGINDLVEFVEEQE